DERSLGVFANATSAAAAVRSVASAALHVEPAAHSELGGSSAWRVLNCPASVPLAKKVPAHLRRTSSHAARGTALHAAMAFLIEEKRSFDDLVGETLNGYTITSVDVANALRPVYAYVKQLLAAPDAEYCCEQRVIFPTIPDSWGTLD